jgi:hypothetical protein
VWYKPGRIHQNMLSSNSSPTKKKKRTHKSWVWWYTSVISALWRLNENWPGLLWVTLMFYSTEAFRLCLALSYSILYNNSFDLSYFILSVSAKID